MIQFQDQHISDSKKSSSDHRRIQKYCRILLQNQKDLNVYHLSLATQIAIFTLGLILFQCHCFNLIYHLASRILHNANNSLNQCLQGIFSPLLEDLQIKLFHKMILSHVFKYSQDVSFQVSWVLYILFLVPQLKLTQQILSVFLSRIVKNNF